MKKIILIILIFYLIFLKTNKVFAMTVDDYDFSDIEVSIDNQQEDLEVNFKELVRDIFSGAYEFDIAKIFQKVLEILKNTLQKHKNNLMIIIIVAIGSTGIGTLIGSTKNNDYSNISSLICRLIIMVVLLKCFEGQLEYVTNYIGGLCDFLQCLMPVYIFSVAFSTGTLTAAAVKQCALMVITIINLFILNFIIPLIKIYTVVGIVNCVSENNSMKRMTILLEKIINYSNKFTITFITGFGLIKRMITPYADANGKAALTKAFTFIPGIGDGVCAASELIIGTGKVLKGSIGVAGVVIILMIAFTPAATMAVYGMIYNFIAAVVEPVADKEIVDQIQHMAIGMGKIFSSVVTCAVLGIVTICVLM